MKIVHKHGSEYELEALLRECTTRLEEIRNLFTRPDECKLTLVIRTPWLDDGGVLVSDETQPELPIQEIVRLW